MRTLLIFQLVFGVFVPAVVLCSQSRIDASGLFAAPDFAARWHDEQMRENDINALRKSFDKLYDFNQATKEVVVAYANSLNDNRKVILGILITNVAFVLVVLYKTEQEKRLARDRSRRP